MGKNNRQRRAAKNRKQAAKGGHRPGPTDRPAGEPTWDLPPIGPRELFFTAVHAHRHGDAEIAASIVSRLTSLPRRSLAETVQEMLELQVSHLWNGGWQPVDLDRSVGRELTANESVVLRCSLASEASGYAALGAQVAPEWMGQLEAVGATRWWEPSLPYLLQLDLGWRDVLFASVRLMNLLGVVPELPTLTTPPAQWREGMTIGAWSNLPVGLLDKVRALLDKAESTTFDAEAEAFTAKAQELMAQHRIDRAVLSATGRGSEEQPVGRRVTIDDPYAETKAVLLDKISSANGGHAVWSRGLGFSTVFAFTGELDAIEELFTSLLVQATAALRREGSKQDRHGRSRTTRFRRSFLVAFAVRIGERLRETVDDAMADAQAETDDALLPILAARDGAVHAAADRAFPDLENFSTSVTDGEGWFAGTLFGDRADVGVGAVLDERAAS